MRAYQVKVDGKNFSLPFVNGTEALKMLERLENASVEMVEVKADDYYRDHNTIIHNGIIRGVYYDHHAERI